jgi:hypothetical protein
LACAGAPRRLQVVLQPLVLAAQPIALALQIGPFAFDASQVVPQARVVPPRARELVAKRIIGRRGTVGTVGHAPFMPVLGIEYKYGFLDRSVTMR